MIRLMQQPVVPRPVLLVGTPILIGVCGFAAWAWMRWGMGIWFDAVSGGFSLCN
jgi:hypothetical protein